LASKIFDRVDCDKITPMDVILASSSPRRRQLLAFLGLEFRVVPADVDESLLEGEGAPDYVRRLAAVKAQAVSAKHSDALLIAADTTVVDGNQILGKPVDEEDAERMLRQLRGRSHWVYTGIALARNGDLVTDICGTEVPMRNFSDAEMTAYIATGDPLDKAGAYAIQHDGFYPVAELDGCYANVVGLPLCHLTRLLQAQNIPLNVDIPAVCRATFGYNCPVYETILENR